MSLMSPLGDTGRNNKKTQIFNNREIREYNGCDLKIITEFIERGLSDISVFLFLFY